MVELDHFLHPGILFLQFVLVAPDLLLLVTYKILLLSPDLLRPLKRLEQLLVIDLEVLVFDVHAVCMHDYLRPRVGNDVSKHSELFICEVNFVP